MTRINSKVTNRVATTRAERNVSAAELAKSVGVSRQTIYAIESGQYLPNTEVGLRLARALEVRMDELFSLADAEPITGRSAKTVTMLPAAEALQPGQSLQLCKVNGRWIGTALQGDYLPSSDGMIAGGLADGKASVQMYRREEDLNSRILLAGCDPAMAVLAQHVRPTGVNLVLLQQNSLQSLSLLKRGLTHIAGSHLREENSAESNVSAAHAMFPAKTVALISFALWQEGLVTAAGNPKGIRSLQDLTRKDVTFVNREHGAGSRLLLDRWMKRMHVAGSKIRGYEQTASGHLAAAWQVKKGKGDCCLSTEACARYLGLPFLPLETVRYDLVVRKQQLSAPNMQIFFNAIQQLAFRKQLTALGGYDASVTGLMQG